MLGPGTFRFLNQTRELSFPEGWNDPSAEKLWLYNLHHFEDLVAKGAEARTEWHHDLIRQWVSGNPPFAGNGWDPYPVSLRIGNWIKWALEGNELEQSWLSSLALQAEYLSHRVEWHLLGNHVFENAKALILAGLFFEGGRVDNWLNKGLRILDRQLDEQILADGGHFERSPMYHALVLEGLLDLIQVSEFFGRHRERTVGWRKRAAEMIAWLRTMSHPDGGIPFFNDAAFDVSLSPDALFGYAQHLGIAVPDANEGEGITLLESSGYIRSARGPFVALLDVAPVGPDYQPGHAHADTLSFELSFAGQRILVNSGTSVYGVGAERLRQRGTAAHNTVVVDGQDSSEVWSGFRVARRARPFDVSVRGVGDTWQVRASHDGYHRLPGRVTHRRTWLLADSQLIIEDELSGRYEAAVVYFHFHPDVCVALDGSDGTVSLDGKMCLAFVIVDGAGELREMSFHPEFGVSVDSQCLKVSPRDGISKVAIAYL